MGDHRGGRVTRDPIWPDVVLIIDGVGIVALVAWMIALAVAA